MLQRRLVLSWLWAVLYAGAAAGVVVETTIPLSPHGGSVPDSGSIPTVLAPSRVLVGTRGPDGIWGNADDRTLLIEGIGGVTTVEPLDTPGLPKRTRGALRVSPSRALWIGAGPDETWETADDVLLLLDDLGGANTVTPITLGSLKQNHLSAPIALDENTVLVANVGPDLTAATADDGVHLVTDLGGTPVVTPIDAPYLDGGVARPVALGTDSFLLTSRGPDAASETADDVVYLVTGIPSAPNRVGIPVSALWGGRGGRALRISPTRAVVDSAGPDLMTETFDDQLVLLDGLGATNTTTPIQVGAFPYHDASSPTIVDETTVAVTTEGADAAYSTADDSVAIVSDLGVSNTVTQVIVGYLGDQSAARTRRLGDGRVALAAYGPDDDWETADDQVAVISGIPDAPSLATLDVPGLTNGMQSSVSPLSASSFAVVTGGADFMLGSGGDDLTTVVSGIDGTPVFESVTAGGDVNVGPIPGIRLQRLGAGRGVHIATGADDTIGTADDTLQVLGDLPTSPRDLVVQKLVVKFKASKPLKGEKWSLKGTLPVEGLIPVGPSDLRVTIGPVTQTLSAADFKRGKKSVSYKDKKNENGPIQKLTLNAKKGTLKLKGRGFATGLEAMAPEDVVVAFDFGPDGLDGAEYQAVELDAEVVKSGLRYKAPK